MIEQYGEVKILGCLPKMDQPLDRIIVMKQIQQYVDVEQISNYLSVFLQK